MKALFITKKMFNKLNYFEKIYQSENFKRFIFCNLISKKKQKTLILNNLKGIIRPGELTALIGPTG